MARHRCLQLSSSWTSLSPLKSFPRQILFEQHSVRCIHVGQTTDFHFPFGYVLLTGDREESWKAVALGRNLALCMDKGNILGVVTPQSWGGGASPPNLDWFLRLMPARTHTQGYEKFMAHIGRLFGEGQAGRFLAHPKISRQNRERRLGWGCYWVQSWCWGELPAGTQGRSTKLF